MATWSNASKTGTTFTNTRLTPRIIWSDSSVDWSGALPGQWGATGTPFSNDSKNSTTFTNVTKN